MHLLLSVALLSQTASAKWLIIEEGGAKDSHDVLDGALTSLGEPFDVKTGKAVAGMSAADLFATYEVIFIGNGSGGPQITDADVKPLIKDGGVIADFVDLGGILFVHGGHNDASEVDGPGGSRFRVHIVSAAVDDAPTITDKDHEFILGTFAAGVQLTNTDFKGWNSTCHGVVDPPNGHLSSLGMNLGTNPVEDQWNQILFSPVNNDPAMIEYTYGCGYVIADMMTFDWAGSVLRDGLVAESAAYVHGIQTNFPFCNLDADEDGLVNSIDNCDDVPNPLQEDVDADGIGDACDPCNHSDGPDGDADGMPDDCDPCPESFLNDTDGDGSCDTDDICPGADDFADEDLDTLPDGCDDCPQDVAGADDDDGDLACNSDDECAGFDDYADRDRDKVADGCDICPDDADPKQKDEDGDGFGGACDCDDTTGDISPAAVELCDEIDNDCDGVIDGPGAIGPVQWFADLDGDGQGAPGTIVYGCEQPKNTATNSNDCDDANPLVFKGATEYCDSPDLQIDSDCDGEPSNGLECFVVEEEEPPPPPTSCGSCSAASSSPSFSFAGLAAMGALLLRRRKQ